ncbi:ion transporter [Alloalcanivorax xenomutans]|jgi:voltage-gated sodium channel|uniref:Ion transporter n=1 Tax=Alloalcanivorax xenomutans TaxID=1094342 RepID=A0A9Q3ZCM0_9GAMM|nr:ion transporter [Alloalcanivorax xenomutans]MBA4720970.1 ion transporter [Alcanivorax sp.]ARB44271.1 voltage-gated sodium channel [Alloalcanivorax xenomutans]MCE7508843.1 ion transporter [Alloalcanivorax xenomutans]PHS70473.1 MAG: ion transporter [Alcanivorax sp.]CUR45193.1 Voltage-gated sodium channel subunit [Alloalcanivorax xenomutans]|tara:strand:- start:1791 stop:2630 length:840 start_codon:yes stop_codon:yes gene_type:complete
MTTLVLNSWRQRLGEWIESAPVRHFITGLILLNAIVLGVETSAAAEEAAGGLLALLNSVILAVFVAEILIKLTAFGPRFFRSGWNLFDFLIVGLSLAPTSGQLAILRSLRILRVLRLLSTVKRLRMLVESLMHSLPGIGWTAALLLMMFYIFGVMGTELFGEAFPEWFGTLGASIYTLFQIMTLESWSMGIARPVIEQFPHAWIFFVPFILISSFMVLNLFIAIIVNATQEVHDMELREERERENQRAHDERQEMLDLLRTMEKRLGTLEERLSERQGG